ncbi:MAG: hypothetical protein JWP30_1223 [Homoserinimonas sp.]|nr:hypothetical protein [Homoserinimonas sp.]
MAKPARNTPDEETTYELNGKGRPTPTRKEKEAANLRPLVSSDRKASSKEARAKYNAVRDRARIGMANGEEKYLPIRDKGVQRRFIRDYVDARFNVGELMIPVMILIIVMTFIDSWQVQMVSILSLWAFFILAVIDCYVAGRLVKRKLAAKFGADKLQKGNAWYTAMRALQMRVMRLPKPQVKRGEWPT